MSETREFPTLDVLTTITGYMVVSDICAVYAVLNWATGESVYTHQLPRISRELQSVVVALHPELAAVVFESDQINRDNWRAFAGLWLDRYGPTISVPKLTADQHERIDPLSELAEFTPGKIVVVKP